MVYPRTVTQPSTNPAQCSIYWCAQTATLLHTLPTAMHLACLEVLPLDHISYQPDCCTACYRCHDMRSWIHQHPSRLWMALTESIDVWCQHSSVQLELATDAVWTCTRGARDNVNSTGYAIHLSHISDYQWNILSTYHWSLLQYYLNFLWTLISSDVRKSLYNIRIDDINTRDILDRSKCKRMFCQPRSSSHVDPIHMNADDCQVHLSQRCGNCGRLSFCLCCWRQRLDDGKPTTTELIQDSGFKSTVGQGQHQRRAATVNSHNSRQHSSWPGVILDSQLSLDTHIASVCRIDYYQLRQLCPCTRSLSVCAAKTLVQAFISSRLDYCNALLHSVSENLMWRLQLVQNAATRMITSARGVITSHRCCDSSTGYQYDGISISRSWCSSAWPARHLLIWQTTRCWCQCSRTPYC